MPRPDSPIYYTRRALLPLAAAALLAGCGGAQRAGTGPVNAGLDSLASGETAAPAPVAPLKPKPRPQTDLERLAEQSAVNLQAVLDNMDQRAGAPVAAPNRPIAGQQNPDPPAVSAALPTAPPPGGSAPPAVVATAEPPPPAAARAEPPFVPPPPEPPKTVPERIEESSLLLVDLLRQQAASGQDPRRAYLALAALEALRPGASQRVISPAGIADDPLTADDQAAVDGVRELVTTLTRADRTEPFPALIRDLADRLTTTQPVRIGAARLCTRVMGYGRFTPMVTSRLMQGRPHRAIVYVELAAFAQRPATESEAAAADSPTLEGRPRFAVDVSQEVHLYHDADGVLAWSLPEQRIVETSTNRRRDFYLVQQVTLPQQLTVGAYRLKVILRDQTTGARDEAIIPLQVVADPSLAAHPRD